MSLADDLTRTLDHVRSALPAPTFAAIAGSIADMQEAGIAKRATPENLRPLFAPIGIDLPATNGDGTFSLPIPATYVIDRVGTVVHAFVDADFTRRAEPADILATLRRLPVHA